MRCDGTPDPTVQKDINTYITLWKDDPEVNITPVLQQCNLAIRVCKISGANFYFFNYEFIHYLSN